MVSGSDDRLLNALITQEHSLFTDADDFLNPLERNFSEEADQSALFPCLTKELAMLAALQPVWQLALVRLQNFAADPEFDTKMQLAFGAGVDTDKLRQDWLVETFNFPKTEIRSASEINGAMGAYAAETDTIYLSQELLYRYVNNPSKVAEVWLEEYGHSIDQQLNTADAIGDEGAIFAGLVQGKQLLDSQLQALRQEDDSAVIRIEGTSIFIEQALGSTTVVGPSPGTIDNPTILKIEVEEGARRDESGLVRYNANYTEPSIEFRTQNFNPDINSVFLSYKGPGGSSIGGTQFINNPGELFDFRTIVEDDDDNIIEEIPYSWHYVVVGDADLSVLSKEYQSTFATVDDVLFYDIVLENNGPWRLIDGTYDDSWNPPDIFSQEPFVPPLFDRTAHILETLPKGVKIFSVEWIEGEESAYAPIVWDGSSFAYDFSNFNRLFRPTLPADAAVELIQTGGNDVVKINLENIGDSFSETSVERIRIGVIPTIESRPNPSATTWDISTTTELVAPRWINDPIISNNMLTQSTTVSALLTKVVNSSGDEADADPNDGIIDVDLTEPGNQVTLRALINYANSDISLDDIKFDLPNTDPGYNAATDTFTINIGSALPTITNPVHIDGDGRIELKGTGVDSFSGLTISSDGSVVENITINNFDGSGIRLLGNGNNTVRSNQIGTDITGTQAIGNNINGILVESSNNKIIGNLISGNFGDGIYLRDASLNTIQGNKIGTALDGIGNLGNGERGIHVANSFANLIGGENSNTEGNTIAFNRGTNQKGGVSITSGVGNSILGNSIFENEGIGIDLGNDGPNNNDIGDIDTGANNLQNTPVSTSVIEKEDSSGSRGNFIEGTLNSTPNTDFKIELFKDDGKEFLATFDLQTDANGTATYSSSTNLAVGIPITSTATNLLTGDTSELSSGILFVEDSYITIEEDSSSQFIQKTVKVSLSKPSNEVVRVDYTFLDGTATSSGDGQADYRVSDKEGFLEFLPGKPLSQEITIEVFRDKKITPEDFEVFARDSAYRPDLKKGTDIDVLAGDQQPYGNLGYRVDKAFDTSAGFQAYGLSADESFYLLLDNPQGAVLANQIDDGGAAFVSKFKEEFVTDKSVFSESLSNRKEDNLIVAEKTLIDLEKKVEDLVDTNFSISPITIYDGNRAPILAVRGTEFGREIADVLDDVNPDGIGKRQYDSAKNKVDEWLKKVSNPEEGVERASSITGHSLGGALSQWIASESPVDIDQVVTFNSPGITQVDNSKTNSATHYITRGDFVSMAGREYLEGTYTLSSYVGGPLTPIFKPADLAKHSVVVTPNLSRIVDGLSKPSNLIQSTNLPTKDLNDPFFNYYPDIDYLEFLTTIAVVSRNVGELISILPILNTFGPTFAKEGVKVAVALRYRGSTERLRVSFGQSLNDFLETIDLSQIVQSQLIAPLQAAYEAIKQLPTTAYDALEELTLRALNPAELDAVSAISNSAAQIAESDIASVVQSSVLIAQQYLRDFSLDSARIQKADLAFGEDFSESDFQTLTQAWINEDFSDWPSIEIVPAATIQSANGAFSLTGRGILLANEFIAQNAENPEAIADVLLEEIGHYVDQKINQNDSEGDEGSIFAAVAKGIDLDPEALEALKNEDDIAVLGFDTLDGDTPPDTFWEAVGFWPVAAWESLVDWPVAGWEAIVDWSPAAWVATTTWTDENWQITKSWTPEEWNETTQFTDEQWETVFPQSGTDARYRIATDIASLAEGNTEFQTITFTITRSGATADAGSVDYSIGGSATNAEDFVNIGGTSKATLLSGTIQFAANELEKTITIDVVGDVSSEADETISVSLSNATALGIATIDASEATTVITNDDNQTVPFRTVADSFETTEKDVLSISLSMLIDNDEISNIDSVTLSKVDDSNTTGTLRLENNLANERVVTYDPNGAFDDLNTGEQAVDTFSYTVENDSGDTDTATVEITIAGLDDDDISPIGATEGDDVLVGTQIDETIDALGGNDLVAGGLGNDEIFGGNGDDILRGDLNRRSPQGSIAGGDDIIRGGKGNDRIGGKAGNDQLFGDDGDDQIWGDDGDDLLYGGLGDDTLTGDDSSNSSGSDTFVLAAGEGLDTITDFEVGIDFIGLAGGLSFGALTLQEDNSDTLVQFESNTLAKVMGVSGLIENNFVPI